MKCYPLILAFVFSLSLASAQEEYGLASYYADKYHGTPTAYGGTYNKNKMTAAHKTHPPGTKIRVTRMDNNQSVVVEVNDKGPFLPGRIVDVSKAAAQRLDLIRDGVTQVKVEVVNSSNTRPASTRTASPPSSASNPTTPPTNNPSRPTEYTTYFQPQAQPQPAQQVQPAPQSRSSSSGSFFDVPSGRNIDMGDDTPYGLYRISANRQVINGFGVQVASLQEYVNALRAVSELEASFFKNILVSVEPGPFNTEYKIIIGPFPTFQEAKTYSDNLKKKYNRDGFVIDFSKITY